MNYFDFYELPIAFVIDQAVLRRKFLLNSKKYHPDFYTMESDEKQAEILELSTQNNEAYKLLKDDEKRMKYVLELKGLLGNATQPKLPQSFLMDMMDVNEQVMELQFDYDAAAHERIQKDIETQEQALLTTVEPVLQSYDDATATPEQLNVILDYYLQNRYLIRLKENMQKLVSQ